jgi:hypothetical protein
LHTNNIVFNFSSKLLISFLLLSTIIINSFNYMPSDQEVFANTDSYSYTTNIQNKAKEKFMRNDRERASKWDGVSSEEFYGEGTEEEPYLIENGAQLRKIAETCNNNINNYAGKYFKLVNDIDLDNNSWIPIGSTSCSFQGNFNGNDKNIYGLTIDTTSSDSYYGLFGYVINSSLYNINIIDCDIEVINEGYIVGKVGAIVAFAQDSVIHDCYVSGNMNIKKIESIGGIIGELDIETDINSDDIIYNCCFTGNITCDEDISTFLDESADTTVGAILGTSTTWDYDKNIYNCCSYDTNINCMDVVECGGLFGHLNLSAGINLYRGNLYKCSFSGNVSNTMKHNTDISLCFGGFCGFINQINNIYDCSMNGNATFDIEVSVYAHYVGGMFGLISTAYGSMYNCKAACNVSYQGISSNIGGLCCSINIHGDMYNCGFTGSITSTTDNGIEVGGLVWTFDGSGDTIGSNVYNCYFCGNIQLVNGSAAGIFYKTVGMIQKIEHCYSCGEIRISNSITISGIIGTCNSSGFETNGCYSTINMITNNCNGSVASIIAYAITFNITISNCFSVNNTILIENYVPPNLSGVGGLIGYISSPGDIFNSYSSTKIIVLNYDDINNAPIGSFVGNLSAPSYNTTMDNCYYNTDLSHKIKPIGLITGTMHPENYNAIGVTTKNMTGNSAKKYMPGLFFYQHQDDTSASNEFIVGDSYDVFIDGVSYTHYPQLRFFCDNKNFKIISDSEYLTRAKLFDLKHISKKINYINKVSHESDFLLRVMRMF